MTSPETAAPQTYYGRYLFAHSPTYSSWARLTASDIHTALHHRTDFEGHGIWFYLNHPIRWVRVVGVVVAFDDLETRHIITLDDGSGHQIDLIAWKSPPPGVEPEKSTRPDLTAVKLHSIVKAKGNVNEFWGRRQVLLKRITVLKDTNAEVAAWAETTKYKRDILSKPWVVTDEVIAAEKRKLATNGEEEEKRRAKKRRKLEREKRKGEEKRARGTGKENMLCDSLLEKPSHEGELGKTKRKVGEVSEVLSPKHKKSSTPSVEAGSYRGRRRPPPPPPLLPQPITPVLPEPPREREESPTSSFRGRRRAVPVPTPNPIPLPPISTVQDIPPDPSPKLLPPIPPLPPPESTYRGRRRVHAARKTQPEPKLPALTSTPTLVSPELAPRVSPPPPENTYRGRRRVAQAEKPRPEPNLQLATFTRDPPPQSPPPSPESTYRGRRRAPQAEKPQPEQNPPPVTSTTQNTPRDPPPQIPPPPESTYRGRRRALHPTKSQPEPKLETNTLGIPTLNPNPEDALIYPMHKRTPKPPADTLPSPTLPSLPPSEPPPKPQTFRGRRRTEKTPPAPNPAPSEPPAGLSHRERWRIMKAQKEAESQLPVIPTTDNNPPQQPTYLERRRASKLQQEAMSLEKLTYRGKRRTPKTPIEPVPISRWRAEESSPSGIYELPSSISTFVPTQGLPSSISTFVPTQEYPSTISTFIPSPVVSRSGRRRAGDDLAEMSTSEASGRAAELDVLPDEISSFVATPEPSRRTSSFHGRRRTREQSNILPDEMSSFIATPEVSGRSSSHRGWGRVGAQIDVLPDEISSFVATPEPSSRSSHPSRWKVEESPTDIDEPPASISSFAPTPEIRVGGKLAYRGKRRIRILPAVESTSTRQSPATEVSLYIPASMSTFVPTPGRDGDVDALSTSMSTFVATPGETSSYRKRKASVDGVLVGGSIYAPMLDSGVDGAGEALVEGSTYTSTPASGALSYRGKRRSEKSQHNLPTTVPASPALLPPSGNPLQISSSYRGKREVSDAGGALVDSQTYVPIPASGTSYRGKRRSEKPLSSRHNLPATVPASPALLPPPGNPSQISSSYRGKREAGDADEALAEGSSYAPTPASGASSYRGKRRSEKLPSSRHNPPATVPASSALLSPSENPLQISSSYRGRRRG